MFSEVMGFARAQPILRAASNFPHSEFSAGRSPWTRDLQFNAEFVERIWPALGVASILLIGRFLEPLPRISRMIMAVRVFLTRAPLLDGAPMFHDLEQ